MDSKVFNAKSSFGCRNRLNFRLFRYTLWFVYIIVARKVPECVNSYQTIIQMLGCIVDGRG